MNWKLSVKLGVMMFLQYAMWGAWSPVLAAYLVKTLGFTGVQAGLIYSALPLAGMVSPMLGGQVADRWMPTQYFLAAAHLFGGILLLAMGIQHNFLGIMVFMFIYSLLYQPTLALTNSLAFHHLKEAEREFGRIRVWGTIGWIIAGLLLSLWRWLRGGSELPYSDALILSGAFSLIMGGFCFFLPHTPPKREAANPWAFLEAIRLFRDRNFALFMGIAFIVTTELQFYYILTAPFLESLGIASKNVPATMTIAQIAEIFVMAFALPYFLPRWGIRKTIALGILAWPVRYIIFAIGKPLELVIAALTLHGFCYVFFFTAAFVYVNSVASEDIRASAQALASFVMLGLGLFLGSIFTGWIKDLFTTNGLVNWTGVFLVPILITIVVAIVFLLGFKETDRPQKQ